MLLKVTVIAVCLTLSGLAADQPKKPGYLQWEIEERVGAMGFGNSLHEFTNTTTFYRTVPVHPDDHGGAFNTIPDATLGVPSLNMPHLMTSTGFTLLDRVTVQMGFDFQLYGDRGLSPGNSGNIREVDIFSGKFQRVEGASLIYNATRTPYWSAVPVLVPEAEMRIWKKIGLLAGAWKKNFQYNIERGYDRYDALQVRDNLLLANATAYHPYFGVRFGNYMDENKIGSYSGVFTVGPIIQKLRFVQEAAGTKISGNTRGLMFNIDFSVGAALTLLRRH